MLYVALCAETLKTEIYKVNTTSVNCNKYSIENTLFHLIIKLFHWCPVKKCNLDLDMKKIIQTMLLINLTS